MKQLWAYVATESISFDFSQFISTNQVFIKTFCIFFFNFKKNVKKNKFFFYWWT